MSCPSRSTLPPSGLRKPPIMLSVVVLPQPDEPRMHKKSALFQAEGEVMHGVFAVKLLAQAVKFEIHGDFLLSG